MSIPIVEPPQRRRRFRTRDILTTVGLIGAVTPAIAVLIALATRAG